MIQLEELTKVFDTPQGDLRAVDNVSLEVPQGELCVLLGPSGCGKTTTLKMVNRLVQPTSGKIYIDGEDTDTWDVVDLRRTLGYVIQLIGLFPNMTVEENIAVVPRLLGWDKKKRHERAAELMEMVALDENLLDRYPNELSGGQQQRVGVARGLAADPPVLLMDEPFGAIDPINRAVIQDQFLKMQARLKKTILFVSHDLDEAVKMGDKIAIFREGELERFDTPDNVLAYPKTEFVTSFVGGDRALRRLRLLSVKDALDTQAPTITAEAEVATAAKRMHSHGTTRIAVLDQRKQPAGVVRLEDIEADSSAECKSVMRSIGQSVSPNDDLRQTVSTMFMHNTDWLPVVDNNGAYEGAISHQAIAGLLSKGEYDEAGDEAA